MSTLSTQSIIAYRNAVQLISPFFEYEQEFMGTSYGLGPAGYTVRIRETFELEPGESKLASILEYIRMPDNLKGRVCDKSSWARKFLSVFNTSIQPGWNGYLTLELTNRGTETLKFEGGMGIAEIEFQQLDYPTVRPYKGRYQNQPPGPQPSKMDNPTEA